MCRELASLYAGISRIPDESTVLRRRRLTEEHILGAQILGGVNTEMAYAGLLLRAGTAVDATLIAAPSSLKNNAGQRDPEMHKAKKGNHWHSPLRPGKRRAMDQRSPWGALLGHADVLTQRFLLRLGC